MASFRINCMDFYTAKPVHDLDVFNSEFRGEVVERVPVIRIYASSDAGVKACVHVHGVFPYIYVPYEETDDISIKHRIARTLDEAINISMGQGSSKQQHVYNIELISSVPFYGYHAKEALFLKISFYNPRFVRKACSLLENSSIMGRCFQPHEAHIPYHQQFMIDYNLHGMNMIKLAKFKFRTKKMSVCSIEVDALEEDILNRAEIGKMSNPGIDYIREDERQRRLKMGREDELEEILTQNRGKDVKPCPSDVKFKALLEKKLEEEPSFLDNSFANDTLTDNTLIEQDAEDLLNLLNDDDDLELDSILSQVSKGQGEEEEEEENELDLTMSLNAILTPEMPSTFEFNLPEFDGNTEKTGEDVETLNGIYSKRRKIAQLDGEDDSSDGELMNSKKKVPRKTTASRALFQTLPVMVHSPKKRSIESTETNLPKTESSDSDNFETISVCDSKSKCVKMEHVVEKERPSQPPPAAVTCTTTISNSASTGYGNFRPNNSVFENFSIQDGDEYYDSCDIDGLEIVELCPSEETDLNLNASEKYDIRHNFFPLPSSSTVSHFPGKCIVNISDQLSYIIEQRTREPVTKGRIDMGPAPSRKLIEDTLPKYDLPLVRNQDPYYGDPKDVTGSVEIGLNVLRIGGKYDVEDFDTNFSGINEARKEICGDNAKAHFRLEECSQEDCVLEPVKKPPTREEICRREYNEVKAKLDESCRISGATMNNTHGFEMSLENLQEAKSLSEHQLLTTLVLELHVQCRGNLKPDPQYDAIRAIFYCLEQDVPDKKQTTGIIAVNTQNLSPIKEKNGDLLDGAGVECDQILYVADELALYKQLLELVKTHDPDIFVGYEIEMNSWGYLIDRGYTLGINYLTQLSRIVEDSKMKQSDHEDHHSELKVTGRIVLDFWRLMKHEIALQSYTFENVIYHVMHERTARYCLRDLTNWWVHRVPKYRAKTAEYYLFRVRGIMRLMEHLDLVGRTSELARLFGILFYEVLSRGTQFRVESMMLRMAKPLNFVPVSPSVQQRAKMRAPEYLPLILEPESKFYKDPVIVLDFQSLYPSMIIAYNYCFSTCVGRIEHLGGDGYFEFGATQLKMPPKRLKRLLDNNKLNFSPCGIGFVKKEVRLGILPKMLQEILDTRLLVKKAMKEEKGNKTMQRILHSRQLGLKLIANVTYGYTAANFSGRMPAVEIGDSVVAKGRETLQRAINLVENTERWNARVVYGDTDSLFVLVPGRSRKDAFRIGAEIAEEVTNANPSPVRLKLEKVYDPCILQTKKRYVGYLYETNDQDKPDFDAKGIETVRRDGCPAVSKMLEKCIKLLFETRDVSLIKKYVLRQFDKLMMNKVSIQDLTFAKEFRGIAGYKPSACVPALELTKKWRLSDNRNIPRSGERVPYVIINGPPGLPLIKLVRSPWDLIEDTNLRPNAIYYITKIIIPPINRCLLLIGADLRTWFNEMPRKQMQSLPVSSPSKGPKTTISQYFATTSCACCTQQTKDGVCCKCWQNPQKVAMILQEKLRIWERNYYETKKICQSCCNRSTDLCCNSLDCPVLYRSYQTGKDLQQSEFVRGLMDKLPALDF
ncbi:PREDICTED: DNA polymerase zeta catalytic subunit [Nicrophorus vespilloides]|uniref:DNA polymerase n=1 Tax=Nicrophorus vespilloides TaxID=110193 RepID=A0ABM1NHN4_NICVS|nr:PREDICTED: DNA polymerase zeta catalytic subunit [Nicrophorus vespilloides]